MEATSLYKIYQPSAVHVDLLLCVTMAAILYLKWVARILPELYSRKGPTFCNSSGRVPACSTGTNKTSIILYCLMSLTCAGWNTSEVISDTWSPISIAWTRNFSLGLLQGFKSFCGTCNRCPWAKALYDELQGLSLLAEQSWLLRSLTAGTTWRHHLPAF